MCAENSLIFSGYACDIWAGKSLWFFFKHVVSILNINFTTCQLEFVFTFLRPEKSRFSQVGRYDQEFKHKTKTVMLKHCSAICRNPAGFI